MTSHSTCNNFHFYIKFADLIADECASSVDTTIVNNSVGYYHRRRNSRRRSKWNERIQRKIAQNKKYKNKITMSRAKRENNNHFLQNCVGGGVSKLYFLLVNI